MTAVCFAKVPHCVGINELENKIIHTLKASENLLFLNEIKGRKNENSIKESLAAYAVLAELLSISRIDPSTLILKRSENGKPYFEDCDLHFSISHSKGLVAAALSDSGKIGVDIECADILPERAKRLSVRFFSEDERNEISYSPEKFARVWTKKEAYAKMCGITLSEVISESRGRLEGRPIGYGNADFSFFEINRRPLTVCLEKEADNIEFFEIDLGESL